VFPLNRLYNFHWVVAGEAARSSQSYIGALETFLKSNGLKCVINLRGEHPDVAWWRYETETCHRIGATHLDAMMDSKRLPLRPMLTTLFDAFEAAPRPFVIKCSGGQDRTSLASALYVAHRFGWEASTRAQRQFRALPYLHFPRQPQRWLRLFLPYARQQSQGASLADWIRNTYDPREFARWLDTNGHAGTYKSIWEPWKPPAKR
jgi:protein tyrosine/serine phosphatase